jgi:hypothetical protein
MTVDDAVVIGYLETVVENSASRVNAMEQHLKANEPKSMFVEQHVDFIIKQGQAEYTYLKWTENILRNLKKDKRNEGS